MRLIRLLLLLGWRSWVRFWFTEQSPLPLEWIRIGVGGALFIGYTAVTSRLEELYSNNGWMSLEGIRYQWNRPFIHSIHHHITERVDLFAFHYLFLACLLLLTVGGFTKFVKWVVLIGHISYNYRNPAAAYGADSLSAVLLWLLCLAPTGSRLSLDSWLANRHGRKHEPWSLIPGSTVLRMIQLQLCIIYLFAGVAKLRGSPWWEGNGVWGALTNYHFDAPLGFFVNNYWLLIVLNYGTLALEVSYAFLIWGALRPVILLSSVSMHLGIGLLMHMHLFGFVSIIANLAFFRVEWLKYFKRGGFDRLCQDLERVPSTTAID